MVKLTEKPNSSFITIPERAERLKKITSHSSLCHDFPLLKATNISAALFERLNTAINYYLYSNLTNYFKNNLFKLCPDMIGKYPNEIKALPNITANGLVLPKKETYFEFNLIHKNVAQILQALKIDSQIDSIHIPINIRLVDGTPNPIIDNRPRSATKVHSDIWAGEPANAIIAFIPVLGDTLNTGISFWEPKEFPKNLFRPLDDFLEGADVTYDATEYKDCAFSKSTLILTDSILLHQTMKSSGNLRLSIDFRFISKQKITLNDCVKSDRLKNYIPFEEWCDYGTNRMLMSSELLKPFQGSDVTKNDYAASFKTCLLK